MDKAKRDRLIEDAYGHLSRLETALTELTDGNTAERLTKDVVELLGDLHMQP